MKPKIKATCAKLQLLSVCLLCLSGKTRCDGNGPAVVTVKQNSDAVLPCSPNTKENIEAYHFEWKKAAQKEVFFYDAGITYDSGRAGQSEEFKGRVSHSQEGLRQGNASIIIRNTAVSDSGNYTCDFPDLQPRQTFHIELVVEPVVVTAKEDGNALLPCSLSTENLEQGYFYWYKVAQNNEQQKEVFQYEKGKHTPSFGSQDDGLKGRVSHFPEELKHGNASIIINKTKMADGGDYICVFPERQTFHIKLIGATSKPNIRTLDETDNSALLLCEVHGNPEPEVEWRDSAGNKLPAQKSVVPERDGFFITLNTTVTKTDHYRCVATQESNSHQISTETFVRLNDRVLKDRSDENIPGATSKPNIITLDQTKDRALLQCDVHGNPQPEVEWRDSAGNKLPAEKPQVSKSDGRFYVTLNTVVTKTDRYRCVATQKSISHQIYDETFVHIPDRVLKDRTDENKGAAPKPNIRTLDETKDSALLQCEANGNPQPEVEWRDSAGNKLPAEKPQVSERDGRFYVTLNTAVTKTDFYRCVATQKSISHQIYTETSVRISDSTPGWIVAGVAVVLLAPVVIILVVVVRKYRIRLKHYKDQMEASGVPLNGKSSRSQEPPEPEV